MSAPELNWAEAAVQDGRVTVGWKASPSYAFLVQLGENARIWQSENRGQRWGYMSAGIQIDVEHVEAGAVPELKQYLAELIAVSDEQAARLEREHEAARQSEEEAKRAQRAADEELQRRLREGE